MNDKLVAAFWPGMDQRPKIEAGAKKNGKVEKASYAGNQGSYAQGSKNIPGQTGYVGAMRSGSGFRNTLTGAGGISDKGDSGFFTPTIFSNRQQLEVMYVQSWACAKFINIPVDDMTIKWRRWKDDSEDLVDGMEDIERELKVVDKLGMAMKAGRLFGTGLLIMVTKNSRLDQELVIEDISEGDLVHLMVMDCFDCHVKLIDRNVYSATYNEPIMYTISPYLGIPYDVHSSRVLRFDGLKPVTTHRYSLYRREWGVSALVPVLNSVVQDQNIAAGASHLSTEASIPVIRMEGFKESMTGMPDQDVLSPDQMAAALTMSRSLWRTMFIDKEDEFERVAVTWAGFSDVMKMFAMRLCAAADIPATRFWGRSPEGMNSTGESDMKNYANHVRAMQNRMLNDPLKILDQVLVRSAGLGEEPPEFEWRSIIDSSAEEEATTSKLKAEALSAALTAGGIDENEFREGLDGDPVFGNLEAWPEGAVPLPTERPGGPLEPGFDLKFKEQEGAEDRKLKEKEMQNKKTELSKKKPPAK